MQNEKCKMQIDETASPLRFFNLTFAFCTLHFALLNPTVLR